MAEEPQPNNVTEGADVDENVELKAKSAEDRKAAAAMAKLDAAHHDDSSGGGAASKAVDQEAMNKAMGALAGGARSGGAAAGVKKEVKKAPAVKLDPKDVALTMDALDMDKKEATELLKAHGGSFEEAARAYISPTMSLKTRSG
ncbi:hypothetical protein MKZ38_000585 [Zalerion maritima]|uniref:Nascent polypeptide-associated complex subunit alpha-like UBA domain-containing protein n=1 Tax=Zalerion maritima TaxID=339359 RepID=A0AAD5WRZ9_9PEZI|nr:hypothetical protein MKZ38_000585 [Zalerion maritima]